MKISGRTAFMMAVFVASIAVLGIKLLGPASVKIIVEGSEVSTVPLPGLFTLTDCLIIAAFSCLVGISGMYLLFLDSRLALEVIEARLPEALVEQRKKDWRKTAKILKDDERRIYEEILKSDGAILQSELVEKTGLSKSTVSRCLDILESKGMVERRRRGMANMVLLK